MIAQGYVLWKQRRKFSDWLQKFDWFQKIRTIFLLTFIFTFIISLILWLPNIALLQLTKYSPIKYLIISDKNAKIFKIFAKISPNLTDFFLLQPIWSPSWLPQACCGCTCTSVAAVAWLWKAVFSSTSAAAGRSRKIYSEFASISRFQWPLLFGQISHSCWPGYF